MRERYNQEILVEDWPGSWDAVVVYQMVDLEVQYAFDGPHFHAPPGSEIEVAARAVGIPFDGNLLWAVKVMANAACEVHNRSVRRR